MKKLRKLTALLSAAIMLSSNALSAKADLYAPEIKPDISYCWGTTNGEAFKDMELLDDKGMLGYDLLYYSVNNRMYGVNFRHALRFVLRDDLDQKNAEEQAERIVRKYYPEYVIKDFYGTKNYDIFEEDEAARTAEVSDSLMHDLAEAGLISAFYTWDQNADYTIVYYGYVTVYNPTSYQWNSNHEREPVYYDWDAVEAWVQAQHPECEFVCLTQEDTEVAKRLGLYNEELQKVSFSDCVYAIIPPEGTTFPEHFSLAVELYEHFGIHHGYTSPASVNEPLIGQNALAVAGDVNLDCSIDVSDAVLVARFAAEDRDAVITDQGRQNADVTHDGNVDGQDTTKILQYIAKKISLEDLEK